VSARRTERLLNLVIALLSTRSWLTKEQVRAAVPQYSECATDEAFDRMFERDKEELRELGVPLVTGGSSAWFEDEQGYKVDRDAYALPEVSFTPAELAVLGLASRVWAQASLGGPAARAVVEPRVRTREPAFEPLYAAARDRAPVAFRYRTGGSGPAARRHVQPWQVTSWHGRWYLVGHDTDRAATRVFRLSRVEGAVTRTGEPGSYAVPEDVDGRALVSRLDADATGRTARLRLRPGAAHQLRLRAGATQAAQEGAEEVEVAFTDVEELAQQVAAAGPDALVLEPADLREAVVRRLRGVLEAQRPGAAAGGGAVGSPR
jgi:predicted DNA-binding transcriptional regulator YafY